MKKNENPLSVYVYISQLVFVIATPLVVFLWGGSYVVKRFALPEWVMVICIIAAVVVMLSGTINFVFQIASFFERNEKNKKIPKAFTSSRRDNDYYDDYSSGTRK